MNQISNADIEEIVEAGMKRKATISLYDNFEIPKSNIKETHYNIKKQIS